MQWSVLMRLRESDGWLRILSSGTKSVCDILSVAPLLCMGALVGEVRFEVVVERRH